MTPAKAAAALDLPIAATLQTALEAAAKRLVTATQSELNTGPGGPHEAPWRQTGALHDSIASITEGLTAQIGSNDPAAIPQEFGTATIPPRPFLAPVAAQLGQSVADDIASTVHSLLAHALS